MTNFLDLDPADFSEKEYLELLHQDMFKTFDELLDAQTEELRRTLKKQLTDYNSEHQ